MKKATTLLLLFPAALALSGCQLFNFGADREAEAARQAAALKMQKVDVALAQYEAEISAKKYSRGDVSFPEKHEKRIAAMKEELALLRMQKRNAEPEKAADFVAEEKSLVGKIAQYYSELLTYGQYAGYLRLFRDSLVFSSENAELLGISPESLDKEIAEFYAELDERKGSLDEKK
ncbi:MAG: hypothetical protein LUD39_05075 [Opitutae bacterium]|nr:hypothetical protein [Opitutae bacterium]